MAALCLGCSQPEATRNPTPPDAAPKEGAVLPAEASAPGALALPCATWQKVQAGAKASFRGASLRAGILWVSGTGGTVGRLDTEGENSGDRWRWTTVPGAEALDFRDVDALGPETAVLMSAGPGDASQIYRTGDGGKSWDRVHVNDREEGFFDGMAFWDERRGLVYGDPVDGAFFVMVTDDGGRTWSRVPPDSLPPALEGEAGFAASGTGVAVHLEADPDRGLAWIGTGGPAARVLRSEDFGRSWTVAETPLRHGEGSRGVFSLAFATAEVGVAVGGDYQLPDDSTATAARTEDGGRTWIPAEAPPAGYRSAVIHLGHGQSRVWLALGTAGSDVSLDDGRTWQPLGNGAGNALAAGADACSTWAVGPEGYLARLAP